LVALEEQILALAAVAVAIPMLEDLVDLVL
jgi:hypothetical protein